MDVATIITLILSTLLLLAGGQYMLVKGRLKKVKELFDYALKALDDDEISKEELKEIIVKAKAIIYSSTKEKKL